jgi:hypothetical protein
MKFFVLTAVLAACAVSSLVRFKIVLKLFLQWHYLMAKMFAQGTALGSPETTACCPCLNNGLCGDGTGCTPYCGYRPWYVYRRQSISHTLLTLFTIAATFSGAPVVVAADMD